MSVEGNYALVKRFSLTVRDSTERKKHHRWTPIPGMYPRACCSRTDCLGAGGSPETERREETHPGESQGQQVLRAEEKEQSGGQKVQRPAEDQV